MGSGEGSATLGYDNVTAANTLPNAPAFPQHMTRRTVWVVDGNPRVCQLLGIVNVVVASMIEPQAALLILVFSFVWSFFLASA